METHLVPFHVASDLGLRHRIYLKAEDMLAGDVKCLMPRRTPQQKAWLFRRIDKEIRTVSTLPALSESRMAGTPERHWISHSFHTLTPNLVKPARNGANQACPKPVRRFSNFLASRATATVIPRLISALKRV